MTNTSIPSVIADEERLLEEFPQIRQALPAWPDRIKLLEYDEVENLTRFIITREIGDVVELWGSGEVRADGTVHLDDGPDLLFPRNGEINNSSDQEAITTAREIVDSLGVAIDLLETTPRSLRRHNDVDLEFREREV